MQVVAKCARKHARRQSHLASYEELLSLGSIGLMQAVRTYRPDSGKDFEIYCYKRIDGAMRYGMKKEGKFYALLWDAAYTHLETTRDEGPSLDEDGGGDGAPRRRVLAVRPDEQGGAHVRRVGGEVVPVQDLGHVDLVDPRDPGHVVALLHHVERRLRELDLVDRIPAATREAHPERHRGDHRGQ